MRVTGASGDNPLYVSGSHALWRYAPLLTAPFYAGQSGRIEVPRGEHDKVGPEPASVVECQYRAGTLLS